MACSQNNLANLGLDFTPPPVNIAWRHEHGNRSRISLKPASWPSLFTFEVPLLAVMLAVLAISVLIRPDSVSRFGSIGLSFPSLFICPLFEVTGIPCLFCGATRSFMSMGGLDFGSAFMFHPLGPIMFLLTVITAVSLTLSLAFRRRFVVSLSRFMWTLMIASTVTLVLLAWPLKIYLWSRTGFL